jgi:hypothetical protein
MHHLAISVKTRLKLWRRSVVGKDVFGRPSRETEVLPLTHRPLLPLECRPW